MPPKSAAARAAKNGKAAEEEALALAPFLGRELRIELQDGRVLVGTLLAYEGSGDLLLQAALEERAYADKSAPNGIVVRGVNLLAIPFKYVKTLHRRKPGSVPLTAVLEAELEQAAQPQAA